MKRLARKVVDAARQLVLPLFDASKAPAITRQGVRLVRLSGEPVEYELRRSRRRTIGFVIDDRGLTVTAPQRTSTVEIENALRERGEWIVRKLVEWREHAARRAQLEIRWEHGAQLPFLGERLTITIDPAHRGPVTRAGDRLHLALPPGAGSEQVRDSVQGWLQRQARGHYEVRIAHFSALLGCAPSRLALSSARTRWGSCSADGTIRLNWRLVHFPPDIVDYVICHELAHLRELNHGPRFWETVGDLFPDHARARQWLKANPGGISTD